MFKGYAAHTVEHSIRMFISPAFGYTMHHLHHELNHYYAWGRLTFRTRGSLAASMTFKFYTTDHLRSVRGIWDGEWSQTVNNLATYDYTPYGDILQQSRLPLDLGFTGHHWDNHIQQYFAPFRFYSPTTLRWNMRDPLGFIDGPSVYAYVGGNPVIIIDPYVLSEIFDDSNIIDAFCNGVIDGTLQLLDTFIPIANPFNSLYDPNAPGMEAGK